MIVIGDRSFAGEIAKQLSDSFFIEIEEKKFPDGEICPRLLIPEDISIENNHVIFAQQLKSNQCKNDYLISLLWTIYNVKRYNPARLSCIMPYHIYSRQDRESRKGEPISLFYLADALENAGIDDFVVVNSHIFGKMPIKNVFKKAEAFDLSAITILGKALREQISNPEELICLAPDEGALLLAEEAAKAIKTPYYGAIHKERDPETGNIKQSLLGVDLEIDGRSFLIVDDLVSSGSTMIGAAKILLSRGARKVYFAYVHAVHTKENFNNILNVGAELILTTDTIDNKTSGLKIVSIIPLLVDWIKKQSQQN